VSEGVSTETRSIPARIEGYDLARALAFLGMVFVNFRIAIAEDSVGSQWLPWLVMRLDGRASATFVVIAGVGLSLVSRRARESGDRFALAAVRRGLLRRGAILLVIGLLYWPIWPADILHYYGVYITIGAILLDVSGCRLWALAGGLVLAFALLLILGLDYADGWDFKTLTYYGFWTPRGFARNLLYNGFHPVIPWLGFLLVGMWLGRRDVNDLEGWRRILVWGVVVAACAELGARSLVRAASHRISLEDSEAVFGTGSMPPMPLYMAAATGTAFAVIALSVLVANRSAGARWLAPLVATGQMALTLYVAHVVIGLVPLEAFGLLEGRRTVAFSVLWSVTFCVGSVIFAALWRRTFSRGPLEVVLRRLAA
jgi:uncharacterized membrane protein YeiB